MLNDKWLIKELTNNILIYGSLKYYQNIKSDECSKLKQDAEDFNNRVNFELAFIDRKILALGKDKIKSFLNQNPQLTVYKFCLDNLLRSQGHVQNNYTNELISNNNDDINHQLVLYNKI